MAPKLCANLVFLNIDRTNLVLCVCRCGCMVTVPWLWALLMGTWLEILGTWLEILGIWRAALKPRGVIFRRGFCQLMKK